MIEEKFEEILQKHLLLAKPKKPTNVISGMAEYLSAWKDNLKAFDLELVDAANHYLANNPGEEERILQLAREYTDKYIGEIRPK